MEQRKGWRPTSSSGVHTFNSLTFLAREKYEMPKIGEAGMIPRTTQIVQNDILVEEIMSAHDHLRGKCNTPSVKERKTRH